MHPSQSLATLRPDLEESLMEFDLEQDQAGMIAYDVFPVIDVNLAADSYGVIPIEQLLKNPDIERAPGTGYSRGKWTFKDAQYNTREKGHEEVVDDNDSKKYAHYFDAELVSAEIARDIVIRSAERRVADAVFNTTIFTGSALTTGVGTKWDVPGTATPILDVDAAKQKVWENCGLWPNTLIINRQVLMDLRNVVQILDRIGSASSNDPKDITASMLARILDIDRVIVAGSPKNTAAEGATATLAPIWSNLYAMVCHINPGKNIKRPTLGRTFHWTEDGSEIRGRIETYREEGVRGEVVRCRHQVDEKLVMTECGHLLTNIN